jgi:hypothetical protein
MKALHFPVSTSIHNSKTGSLSAPVYNGFSVVRAPSGTAVRMKRKVEMVRTWAMDHPLRSYIKILIPSELSNACSSLSDVRLARPY